MATILVSLMVVIGITQAQKKTFQFTFANHINELLDFYVDDVYACVADPGMTCHSTVGVGAHVLKAQGKTVTRYVEVTLYENADNPHWVICYSETGSCE